MAIQKRPSVLVEAIEDPKPAKRRALLSAASTRCASAQKGVGPTWKCDAPHDRRHGVRHDFMGRGRLVQRQSFVRDALSVCTCEFHVQSKQEVSHRHVRASFRCANDHAPAANPRFPPSNKPRALCGTTSGAAPGILDLACPAARRQAARTTARAAMPSTRTTRFSPNLPQPSHNSHPLSEFSLSQPSHNSRPLPQPFMSQLHTRFDDLFRRKRTSHRRSWVARVPTNPLGDALEQTRQHPSLATVALFAFLPLIRGKQALPRWNGCSSTCEYNAFILVHLCHDVHAGAKNASNRSSHGSICQGMFRLLQGLLSLSVLDNLCTASSFLLCGTCNSIEILPT